MLDMKMSEDLIVTHVVTGTCVCCKYMDCAEVCPVGCFHEGENMLVIDPGKCVDCGVCACECPMGAIISDTAPGAGQWVEVNRTYARQWPEITQKGEVPSDADAWRHIENKFSKHFSPLPASRK